MMVCLLMPEANIEQLEIEMQLWVRSEILHSFGDVPTRTAELVAYLTIVVGIYFGVVDLMLDEHQGLD